MRRPRGSYKRFTAKQKAVSAGFDKANPGFIFGPITGLPMQDKLYQVVTGDKVHSAWSTLGEAQFALSKLRVEHGSKVEIVSQSNQIPKGELTVPEGTLVYVYRLGIGGREPNPRPPGWVKYHLKKERTFQECHQVTTLNPGLMVPSSIRQANAFKWIVFHTEKEDYPLIAFSAFTEDFPLVGDIGVHDLGDQEGNAFPHNTPLTYPPKGNTFGRLFKEQKTAFNFKGGFNPTDKLKKQVDNKHS